MAEKNNGNSANAADNRQKGSARSLIVGGIVLIAAIAVMAAAFFAFREKPTAGSKSITIAVVGKTGTATDYAVRTDAEYLRQAMEEAKGLTFSGTESEFGMMVDTVNGDTADYSVDGAYWSFYVNGEYCNYGIDTQPVKDGDNFRIEYTVWTE